MTAAAPTLVCPETLRPLEERADGWWSPGAQRLYPTREGLVFLGFPTHDRAEIDATMREEHAWQGTPETIERDTTFLRSSAPRAVDLINLIARHLPTSSRPQAIELGSGSGWVSSLLTQAGCDTWACDFEANSLAVSLMYDLGAPPRRFVTDARYVPFPDATFDLVVTKEFVHHVADYDALFREANRVLRPGGLLALFEPVKSLKERIAEIRYPDPHEGHHIVSPRAYPRALRRAGYRLEHEALAYSDHRHRVPVVGRAKARAVAGSRNLRRPDRYARAHNALLGGAHSVIVARKVAGAPARPRPPMTIIDPSTLVISEVDRARFRPMREIVETAAQRLETPWGTGVPAAAPARRP